MNLHSKFFGCLLTLATWVSFSPTGALAQPAPWISPPALFSVSGQTLGEQFGATVESFKDLNNDGFKEMLVSTAGIFAGQSRVEIWDMKNQVILRSIAVPQMRSPQVRNLGDVNGDGLQDFVVYVPGGFNILNENGGLVLSQTTYSPSAPPTVARLGNVNGLAGDEILIETQNAFGVPQVLTFDVANNQIIATFNNPIGGNLGTLMAGGRDLDGDGIPDFVVSVSSGANKILAVSGATGIVLFQAGGPGFFISTDKQLAFIDDFDNDGTPDILSGLPGTTLGLGVAQIFSGRDGHLLWLRQADDYSNTHFGANVNVLGDVTGDGRADFAISNPYGTPGNFVDRVLIISGADGSVAQMIFDPSGAQGQGEGFGASVAALGDINSNGSVEVLVNRPGKNIFFGATPVTPGSVFGFSIPQSFTGSHAEPFFGTGLGGSLGIPQLDVIGTLTNFALLTLAPAPANAFTMLVMSPAVGNTVTPQCGSVVPDFASASFLTLTTDASGAASLFFSITGWGVTSANNRVYVQAAVVDVTSPTGFSCSNAVEVFLQP